MLGTEHYQHINQWFQEDLGQSVLQAEKQELDKVIGNYFGYHLVQLGSIGTLEWVQASPIQNKFWCSPWWRNGRLGQCIQGDLAQLPLSPKSVDLMVLPHVLEFEKKPAEIIEQACLALIPEGHLIIFGFNPYSPWGIKRRLMKQQQIPWSGQFYSIRTLRKWLATHHCTIDAFNMLCFQLPIASASTREKLKIIESIGQTCWPTNGGVYCIIARKQVAAVTPIQLSWRMKPLSFRSKRAAEPTTSRGHSFETD